MRKLLTTLALGAILAFGAPTAAQAQVEQDGLVNVHIGDVEISDINVTVAAQIVASVCNLNVTVVAGIISDIDNDGGSEQFCEIGRAGRGPTLTVTQN